MSYWEKFRKTKQIIPPQRDPAIGGIIVIIKGIMGIATEIGYALAIMLAAFFICVAVASF